MKTKDLFEQADPKAINILYKIMKLTRDEFEREDLIDIIYRLGEHAPPAVLKDIWYRIDPEHVGTPEWEEWRGPYDEATRKRFRRLETAAKRKRSD